MLDHSAMTTADPAHTTLLRAFVTTFGRALAGEKTLTVGELEAAFTAAVREIVDQHQHSARVTTYDDADKSMGYSLDLTHEHHSIVTWKDQAT